MTALHRYCVFRGPVCVGIFRTRDEAENYAVLLDDIFGCLSHAVLCEMRL